MGIRMYKCLDLPRRARLVAVGLAFVSIMLTSVSAAAALSGDSLYLTAKGNSMYPTIKEGDQIKVKMCTNGRLINVGDIIVYCTIAANLDLDYMWIGHRVIEKYQKDGHSWFRTRGDNNAEPDPWEVPEYFLLGIVVEITHTSASTTQANAQPVDTSPTNLTYDQQRGWMLSATILAIAVATLPYLYRMRHEKRAAQTIAKPCNSCTYYEAEITYRVEIVDGRFGIRKILDQSKGFCNYHNMTIFDGSPTRKCRNCNRTTQSAD